MKKTYSAPVVTSSDVARETEHGAIKRQLVENQFSTTGGLGFGL